MFKQLISDSAIYGVGAILIKSIAFFTLPIYTSIFSPEEFGIIEMFSTVGGFLTIFMTMGLDSAQSYYYMDAKNNETYDKKAIITSILQLRIVLGILILGVVVSLSPFIIDFAFKSSLPISYLIMVSTSIFFSNLISQSLEVFRLLYKPWQFIGLSFMQTVFNIGLILYFSYYKDMGIEGYFIGNLLGMTVVMLIGWIATKNYRYWDRLEVKLWKGFLKFGLPLVPAGLMIWVMLFSDRWFIQNFLGSYELGLYAVSAKFAIFIAIAVEVFRKAFFPIAMDMIHKPEGKIFFEKITTFYIVIGSIGVLIITYISPYLIEYLLNESYLESWKSVGLLSLASLAYGFRMISNRGILYVKKTHLLIYIYTIGAS